MLGTVPIPEGLDEDAYLERYADRLGTGLVPVAGLAIPSGAKAARLAVRASLAHE
jgi:hypothetical protein